jgi:hypothetical protein
MPEAIRKPVSLRAQDPARDFWGMTFLDLSERQGG